MRDDAAISILRLLLRFAHRNDTSGVKIKEGEVY